MDDVIELQRRKIMLLSNNNLNNLVDKMIKTKGLPAKLDSITLIAGIEGKPEIVVLTEIVIMHFIAPAVITLGISEMMRYFKWIKKGDMELPKA